MPGGKKSNVGQAVHRMTLRLPERDYERLQYYAEREDCSVNELILRMLDQWIDIANGNYALPTLEIQRLNQLTTVITELAQNQQSLESIIINGFNSLLNLTRGDNYLLSEDADDVFGEQGGEEDGE